MNSPAENVSIDRVRVNHVPQKTPVTSARRNSAAKVANFELVRSAIARCLEHGYYRLSSQIQFVSHVFPPSGEKDCSIRADFGEIFNQT